MLAAHHSRLTFLLISAATTQYARCMQALAGCLATGTHHFRLTFLLISAATSSGSSAGWPTEDTVAAQLRYSSEPSALRTLVQDSAWGGERARTRRESGVNGITGEGASLRASGRYSSQVRHVHGRGRASQLPTARGSEIAMEVQCGSSRSGGMGQVVMVRDGGTRGRHKAARASSSR